MTETLRAEFEEWQKDFIVANGRRPTEQEGYYAGRESASKGERQYVFREALTVLAGCMPPRIYVTDETWSSEEPETEEGAEEAFVVIDFEKLLSDAPSSPGSEREADGWVSVEKFPDRKEHKWVLVSDGELIDVALVVKGMLLGHREVKATHWRPLPAPPRSETEEKA